MNMTGSGIRLHTDAYINYVQAGSGGNTQNTFTDDPDSREIERRIKEIQRIFPDYGYIRTCAEAVADMELAPPYVVNPVEMYLIFPVIILATTGVSAFLTSLYTRKIKSSDTANIE